MQWVGAIGHGIAGLGFLVLAVLMLRYWKERWQGMILVAACLFSALWALSIAYHSSRGYAGSIASEILEILRNGAWLGFLFAYLMNSAPGPHALRLLKSAAGFSGLLLVSLVLVPLLVLYGYVGLRSPLQFDLRILGHIALAVIGLILVEHLFRHARSEHQRWGVKFFCLGVGGMFAYDFYLYSDALLFKQIDLSIWIGRGIITVLIIPLIALSAVRQNAWAAQISLSRALVFRSTAITAIGLYLLVMAAGGYYVKIYGGTWGGVAQVAFLFGTVLLLIVVMFSGQMRARLKVLIDKHIYHYKYDHREEWLRIIRTLSIQQSNHELRESAIRVISDTVESPAGMLWLKRNDNYEMLANWNMLRPSTSHEPANGALPQFMRNWQWIIDLDEYRREPDLYRELEIPAWLNELPRAWLVVPLMHQTDLLGFVVLSHSRAAMKIKWEDRDLLLTAGRQAASYMALVDANEALAEARQFDAFNRLSAYVVHDLKNLVAQLNLVAINARKFKHHPDFMDDAVMTIENAVGKMNKLLNQLKKGRLELGSVEQVNIIQILEKVVERCASAVPVPEFHAPAEIFEMVADPDRLAAVIEHLVQNAQEATSANGYVRLRVSGTPEWVILHLEDNGSGMDEQFIRERLFRPFDTTKGNAGMGIGAYESREFVHLLGGTIDVQSQPGQGTTFIVRLPRAQHRTQQVDTSYSHKKAVL